MASAPKSSKDQSRIVAKTDISYLTGNKASSAVKTVAKPKTDISHLTGNKASSTKNKAPQKKTAMQGGLGLVAFKGARISGDGIKKLVNEPKSMFYVEPSSNKTKEQKPLVVSKAQSNTQKRDYVVSKLVSLGMNKGAAAAFAGNMWVESFNPKTGKRFDTNAIGDLNLKDHAFGIAQWRQERLNGLKQAFPNSWQNLDSQIKYVFLEATGKAPVKDYGAEKAFKIASNPNLSIADKTAAVFDNFERGSKAARRDTLGDRINAANAAYGSNSVITQFNDNAPKLTTEIVKSIPENIPFKPFVSKGFDILKAAISGKKSSDTEIRNFAVEAGSSAGAMIGGPFGDFVSSNIKSGLNNQNVDNATNVKNMISTIGALFGGPIGGAAASTFGGAAVDAVQSLPKTFGTTNFRIETLGAVSKAQSEAVARSEKQSPDISYLTGNKANSATDKQTNESGNKSLYDSLFDASYNPLNSQYWSSSAFSIAVILSASALIGFGIYSMVSKSNNVVVSQGA